MNEKMIFQTVGEVGLAELCRAFYRRVKVDRLIGGLYPDDDWEGAEERLLDFLCFRFGGITRYTEKRGHPRLRARHMPFSIGKLERDRWMELMGAALEETVENKEIREEFRQFFAQVADFMRNRPEEN